MLDVRLTERLGTDAFSQASLRGLRVLRDFVIGRLSNRFTLEPITAEAQADRFQRDRLPSNATTSRSHSRGPVPDWSHRRSRKRRRRDAGATTSPAPGRNARAIAQTP